MGLLAVLLDAMRGDNSPAHPGTDTPGERRVRCRNCGRYYADGTDACPHCGSGNQLRSGAPDGQTRH